MMNSHVKEIMTTKPSCCALDHPLTCALEIMRQEDCGAVPVVDEAERVKAMITDRDIALCLLEHPKPFEQMTVRDCARHVDHVITVHPDDSVERAIQLMEQHQVKRLPVCDDRMRCVGIVAQADIIRKHPVPETIAHLVQSISKTSQTVLGSNR
jgi:CBS domain-containing protein